MAALLGARLIKRYLPVIQLDNWWVWCDSDNVLYWLRSEATLYSSFISSRKEQILAATPAERWRHIPSELNPADDLSRGVKASELTAEHRSLAGPAFLLKGEKEWPQRIGGGVVQEDALEIIRPVAVCEEVAVNAIAVTNTVVGLPPPPTIADLIEAASSLTTLKRSVAELTASPNETMTPASLRDGLNRCVQWVQRLSFASEVNALSKGNQIARQSKLRKLSPFLDADGLLRVGGRLTHAYMTEDAKHPLILPYKHKLTKLAIADVHENQFHSQTEGTLYELRATFWVIKGRRAVREVVGACLDCRKRHAKPFHPEMAPLPACRVTPFQPPFSQIGVDYFGPLYVTVKRSTEKRYGVLFTCLATRAVNIELAETLDTDSCLMAWRRHISLRGTPTDVWSDNGTNLTACEKELKEGLERIMAEGRLVKVMADRGVNWYFSPPSAPHFGGSWESLVKAAKHALRVVLGCTTVKEEVLRTVMAEVVAILNARPLTHLSVDPEDESPLTPNHFLLGRAHPHIPPDVFDEEGPLSHKRWRQAQELTARFWRRWMLEYVPSLMERRKWTRKNRNVQVGDLVLIVDQNAPRGTWLTGTVSRLLPAKSSLPLKQQVVRTVWVKTATGEFRRPVVKLCLLRRAADSSD